MQVSKLLGVTSVTIFSCDNVSIYYNHYICFDKVRKIIFLHPLLSYLQAYHFCLFCLELRLDIISRHISCFIITGSIIADTHEKILTNRLYLRRERERDCATSIKNTSLLPLITLCKVINTFLSELEDSLSLSIKHQIFSNNFLDQY